MKIKEHWDSVYRSKSDADLSWTQPESLMSLRLIRGACASGRLIDEGGGTSVLPVTSTAHSRLKCRLGQAGTMRVGFLVTTAR
jgi:hypothetical protein